MPAPKKLVLFVEGQSDADAVPVLVKKLLSEFQAGLPSWFLAPDPDPFRVGKLADLSGRRAADWTNKLKAALKRGNVGAVLLLLDGDAKQFERAPFHPITAAQVLAQRARSVGAGSLFSVAVVFACMEYESWLIAGVEALAGQPLPPDGRPGVRPNAKPPAGDLEVAPRGAKEWLSRHMHNGYKESTDQKPLTELLIKRLDFLRDRPMPSFLALESSLRQLIEAIRTGSAVAIPEPPSPAS